MKSSNISGLPDKRGVDILVDHGIALVVVVLAITVASAACVSGLEKDSSLKSLFITTSPAHHEYEEFRKAFGKDDFLVAAIKNPADAADPRILQGVQAITEALQRSGKIAQVLSLTNLRMFQKRGEMVGTYPVVRNRDGVPTLPDRLELDRMRKAMPLMDLLVSHDLKTVGVLVQIDERWRFNASAMEDILELIDSVVRTNAARGSEIHIVGTAVIGQAILRYSIQTAVVFGILCALICTVVTAYIFRTIKVTLVTMAILCMSVLWLLGLMSLLKIPLNAATSLSFGLILITSLEVVIHVVTRYQQFHEVILDRKEALREAVRFLTRPVLICSATTAVGFGACMVTSIPMVFQLGLIMSLGIVISFCLLMAVTPSFVLACNSLDAHRWKDSRRDCLSRVLLRMRRSISRHHRAYVMTGFILAVFMFAGTPLIRTDPQILRQLSERAPEIQAIKFVEQNLSSVHYLQVVLESKPDTFKNPEQWRKVAELEKRLRDIPEVVAVESLRSFLDHIYALVDGGNPGEEQLFTNRDLIRQLLFLASLSEEGKSLTRQYVNESFDRARISVRIRNSPAVPIGDTIERIKDVAESVMGDASGVTVTGELAVIAQNGVDLIRSEISSMVIAASLIAALLIAQMGSVSFGLLSLIPSIPPVAGVFGIMGWLGIPLDGVTIFAATVATGLAVDNTIHYVAQLKREMTVNPGLGVEACVFRAYGLAAKPMAAWGLVTLLGFLAMAVTPFRAAVSFGLLVASAVFLGMFGDLVLMQSLILTSPRARDLITRLIKKGNRPQRNP